MRNSRKDEDINTYLYRITNLVNGNDYVGITVNVKKRWRDHIRDSRKEPKPGESLIAKGIRIHGKENFKFEVIAIARTWNIGCDLERLARHLGMGKYNKTGGGEGPMGLKHSDESKAKMRVAKIGKKREISPEHRAKLVANGQARKGVPKTAEHKANMSKATKGVKRGPQSEETIAKKRLMNLGKKASDDAKANMSAAATARNERSIAETGMTPSAARWAKVKELGLRNFKELAEYELQNPTTK